MRVDFRVILFEIFLGSQYFGGYEMSGNTQTVYIVERPPECTSDEEHFEKTFPAKAVTILSALQIVAGGLAFISEVCA